MSNRGYGSPLTSVADICPGYAIHLAIQGHNPLHISYFILLHYSKTLFTHLPFRIISIDLVHAINSTFSILFFGLKSLFHNSILISIWQMRKQHVHYPFSDFSVKACGGISLRCSRRSLALPIETNGVTTSLSIAYRV